MDQTFATQNKPEIPWRMIGLLILGAIAWLAAYNLIQPLANWIAYSLLAQPQGSHLGDSLAFFFYDVPKIILLLGGMIFLISLLRTFFSAEQTRAWLGGKREGVGNMLAAMLGIVTPFCSCSAVPLFIGFVESGIPLGVTFSFLIAAPTINEVAVVLLFGLFGWKVAGLYIASGLTIAIIAGVVIGRLKMERYVEDFVWQLQKQGEGVIEKADPPGAHRTLVGFSQGNRRQSLALRGGRHRRGGGHSRLRAGCGAGRNYGQTSLVVGSRRRPGRHSALLQRGGRHPHRQRFDGKRRFARHRAGLHDVGCRTEPAGDHHPAPRAQAAVDRGLHRCHCRGDHHHRIFVQLDDVTASALIPTLFLKEKKGQNLWTSKFLEPVARPAKACTTM